MPEVQGTMTCRMWGCENEVSDSVDGSFCSTECRVTREKREADAKQAMIDEITAAEAEEEGRY